jgi:hypothetical protein
MASSSVETSSPASQLARLSACGIGALAIYLAAFTLAYPIPTTLTKPLSHFGRITGPSLVPTLGFVGALAGLFVLYVISLRLCARLEGQRRAYSVVAAFAVLCSLVLLPMYPIFSLDVFYYMSADRIWSVYHENPFVVPPLQAAHDPFFPYTTWGHYPLPYGPLWPWITRATSAFGAGEVVGTLVAFKALGVLGYLLATLAVAWAVGAIRPDRRLTGLCIFAWNPLVLVELAGNGHNDAIALVPALLAVGLWARGRSAASAVSFTLSFLTKATVAVIGPALLAASCRRALSERRLPRWLWTHLVPVAILYVVAWIPFHSATALGFLREAEQYYQSITSLVAAAVPSSVSDQSREGIVRGTQLVLLAGFAAFYVSQLRWLTHEDPAALRAIWRILLAYFLVVSPFFSAWYFVWPTAIAALLAERRTTVLTTLLCIGGLSTYIVQFVVRPLAGPAMGLWLFSALGLLVAAGPFLVGWALARHRPSLELMAEEPAELPVAAWGEKAKDRPLAPTLSPGGGEGT